MKRFIRILAVFLTLVMLSCMVWLSASATTPVTTTTLGFENDFDDLSEGTDFSSSFPSGTGAALTYSSALVVNSGMGNNYLRYAYKAEMKEKAYRRDLSIGNYASTNSDKLTHLSDYSYFTVDFDIAADKYSYFVGYKVVISYTTSDLSAAESATVNIGGTDYAVSVTSTRAYSYKIQKLYKSYDAFDEEVIAADIAAAHSEFMTELASVNTKIAGGAAYSVLTYADTAKTTPATVRRDTHSLSGLPVSDVNAYVIDNGYAEATELDGESILVSSVTLEDAKASERLSYSDYTKFMLDARQVSGTTALNKTSGYTAHTVNLIYSDGEWQIRLNGTNAASYTGYNLSDKLGEWNHFTYAVKSVPKLNETTGKYTYGYSEVRLYFNGELIGESTNISGSKYLNISDDIVPRAIDWQIERYAIEYSMAIDNFVTTYYPVVEKNASDPTKNVNYTSGDAVGIDDLFDAESGVTNLTECEDVVYSADYNFSPPNGYVEIDGKKLFTPSAIEKALKSLKNGAEIKTTFDTLEIDPPIWTSITVKCNPGTVITLSKDAIARGVSLTKTPTGYNVSSGIKANMSLFTNMRFNLYLPKTDGVEITAVDGAHLSEGTVRVLGTEMHLISAVPEVNSFEAIEATVSYTVDGEAKTLTALLDPMSYATSVAATYDCGSEEATLIYEMVKYKEAIATFLDDNFSDASGKLASFKKIYSNHDNCKCQGTKVTISDAEAGVDYSALIEKGVKGIAYKLSLNEIGMAINVEDGVTVSSVSYVTALGETVTHTEDRGNLIKKNGYYLVSGVSAAYIDEIMTITVDGVNGTYSLGKYIKNNPDTEVAKSIYTYAVAAEAFKNLSLSELIVSVEFLRESAAVGNNYVLEGYFAGASDEGYETNIKEALFKDVNSDKLISVQGIPYGIDYDFGYEKGDLVRLTVTLMNATDEHGSKLYGAFIPEKNPESVEETIISRGNALNYRFDDAVLVESWADMKDLFNIASVECYTYVHIKGHGYINYYSDKDIYRPHMNANATDLTGIKPDASRALAFRGPVLRANISDEAWADYKTTVGHYPAKHNDVHEMELDVYCVLTKNNYYNFILTPLEDDWFVDHEHTYDGEWITETPSTIFEEGNEYRECKECSIREYRKIAVSALANLEIAEAPVKTDYLLGEALDLTGLKVLATDNSGAKYDVTKLISVNKVLLDVVREEITLSYMGSTLPLNVRINVPTLNVSEVKQNGEVNKIYYVDGYVAGFAQDGPGNAMQVVVKDLVTDDMISLIYAPENGYTKGDRINVYATLTKSTSDHTPNKLYLSYSASNYDDVSETIISVGNEITYKLDNVVTLSSFDEWKKHFKVGEIDEYTFVKITEPLYASGYKSSNDNKYIARIHTDADATAASATKVDGTRYVSFRDNIMELNLGTDWQNYFEGSITSSAVRAMTFKSKEVIALYTGANSAYFQLTVLDEEWFSFEPEDTDYTLEDIAVEIAYAYTRRGSYIQYNQTMSRRHINPSPEEATAENILYLDCSSFVNAVYYEAFGVNVMPYALTDKIDGVSQTPQTARFRNYARDHQDNPDVVGYWLISASDDIEATLAEISGSLKAGDVVNYRKGKDSSGHAMLYIGDGKFIHCSGDDFKAPDGNDYPSDSDNSDASLTHDGATSAEKSSGAVRLETTYMSALFTDTSNSRYLGAQYDVSVIRPIARGVVPTEETVNRMALRGLYIEKSVDVGVTTAVSRGDTITYTLTFNNTLQYARDITITELLSENVSYVSSTGSATLNEGVLTITAKINPFKKQTVSFTVKVNENAVAGALIESANTTVNGINLLGAVNTVSAYTDAELAALADKAKEYAETGKTFDDPALMAKTLYKEVLGVDIYDFDTALDLLNDMIDVENYGINASSETSDIVAPFLYGGRDISGMYIKNKDIIRLITENNISVGDVILAYDESEDRTVAYVYLGESSLLKITSDGKTCESVTMTSSIYEASNILVTIYAYDKYVVIRPSMR